MHREEVGSSPLLRYAIPVAGAVVAAQTGFAVLTERLPLALAAAVLALILLLLWLALQFGSLFVYVDREGVYLAFGRIERQVLRSAIKSARPFRVTLWNAGGLGVHRGWKYEAWIARTGNAVELTLRDGRRFVFSADRPEAAVSALRLAAAPAESPVAEGGIARAGHERQN
jgi:hypothetical protein